MEVPTVETVAVEPGIDPDGRTFERQDETGNENPTVETGARWDTQAEMDARTTEAETDARRRREYCSIVGVLFSFVVVIAAMILFGHGFLFYLLFLFILLFCSFFRIYSDSLKRNKMDGLTIAS
jgi:hypothetical protein